MRLWGGRFAADSNEQVAAFGRSIDVDVEMALDDLDGSMAHVRGLGRAGILSDEQVAAFGRSIDVDAEMALDDLDGSMAHVRGLGRAGILSDAEVTTLLDGLADLRRDLENGELEWDPALEDIHLNIEAALTERLGPIAGKLHTGRSRNDQVATDVRLWTRRAIDRLDRALVEYERVLVGLAEREGDAVLPGSTHTQPAQPVLFGHHLLAYVEMAERDRGRLADARRRLNLSPLGAGALAGAGYRLDREATAADLGFDGVTANSLDAVGDRDFVVETLAAVALTMVHLSRLAEEIAWWSNPRFGFVRVADAYSTGSSMMPNKRNPDPAELVRGRAAAAIAAVTGELALVKGLPLGYQRDLQEDKPPLFRTVATCEASLAVMSGLIGTLGIDRDRMADAAGDGYTTATTLADGLVRRGVPFRAAHHIVGALVGRAERGGIRLLSDVPPAALSELLAASDDETARRLADAPGVAVALLKTATIAASLAAADVIGGTAPARVAAAIAAARARLDGEAAASPQSSSVG